MARFTEYDSYDGLGLAELVRRGQITPLELVEEAIARIEAVNPRINAVIHKFYDDARAQAKGKLPDGPFAGVPFLLKDLAAALAGKPLESGTRFYKGWKPDRNSELVNRFLASGVIVVGKSNSPEFGMLPSTEPVSYGPTRNPWNLERTAGGSSGGTGAAVAARMVPLASGGDGGGSIRIPASCNGVFGLKPTRGRTPTGPYAAEAWHGFAIEHVLSISVRDSAAMLDAVSGPNLGDFHYLPKPDRKFLDEVSKKPGKLRIAAGFDPLLPGKLDPDCRAAMEDAIRLLKELGHEVVEAQPRIDGHAFARAFLVMVTAHIRADIHLAETRMGRTATRADFEEQTWLSHKMGAVLSAGEYVEAVGRVHEMCREVHRFTEGYDLLLNPTLALPPQPLGFLQLKGLKGMLERLAVWLPIEKLMANGPALDLAAEDTFAFIPYTPVYNASGQPSMSLPLYWSRENLPIGVMFTGKFGDENTLFRLAGQLEEARPWKNRKPPVSG